MPSPTPVGATRAHAYAHVAYRSYVSCTQSTSPTIVTMAPGMASPTPPRGGMKIDPTSIARPGTTIHSGQAPASRLRSTRRPNRTTAPTTTRMTPATSPGCARLAGSASYTPVPGAAGGGAGGVEAASCDEIWSGPVMLPPCGPRILRPLGADLNARNRSKERAVGTLAGGPSRPPSVQVLDLAPSEAAHLVVVHQARGLHQRVADGRPHEREATCPQVPAHRP